VDLHHLGHRLHRILEALQPLGRMVARLDRDQDVDAEADLLRIQDRHPPLDDAVRLQPLDTPPAGRLAEIYPGGDLGDRKRGVLLQDREDLPVGLIHSAPPRAGESPSA
jgi:hypothetical protein